MLADELADQHDQPALPLPRQILPADRLPPRIAHGKAPPTEPARAGLPSQAAALQEPHIQRSHVQTFSIGLKSGE
jgi:hypothetical protein